MLELKQITKVYPAGNDCVQALQGIDLKFRKNEFVAVLGPSGCGKTTLLNIIGGLDRFTEGDLLIDGVSTKKYRARDWDAYRNHSVGFVFQSYNLIPHQNVLRNVEMSLTLSGVGKRERRRRAKEALERVGLGDQLRKRPGEMSGGQCQRVAIARAIVNDPEIILADEPTGALDTQTSLQVMEILKEIARDRLVIMVTHNPDLAGRYATRTVTMLDGRITGDSMPLSTEEAEREMRDAQDRRVREGRKKRPSMSASTSFGLSLRNLFTKKGRTVLTSFAGSIGIIGIALIYAVSQGTTMFIDSVQEETLSSYPITVEAQTVDTSSLMTVFMGKAESVSEHTDDAVYQKTMMYDMLNAMNTLESRENDLRSFRAYIEEERVKEGSPLNGALSGVQYTYDTQPRVYTRNVDGELMLCDTSVVMREMIESYMGLDMTGWLSVSDSTLLGSSYTDRMESNMALWKEMLGGNNGEIINPVFKRQYELSCGRWPEKYDEVILFVDENNEVDDLTLYALGLTPRAELDALMDATMNRRSVDYEVRSWSFNEICGMELRLILPCDAWTRDDAGKLTDLRENAAGLTYLYDNALNLHIVGVARPDPETAVGASDNSRIGYTGLLTEWIMEHTGSSELVKEQLDSPDTDLFTGLSFSGTGSDLSDAAKAERMTAGLNALDRETLRAIWLQAAGTPSEEELSDYTGSILSGMSREDMIEAAVGAMSAETGMNGEMVRGYLNNMEDEQLRTMFEEGIAEQMKQEYAERAGQEADAMDDDELRAAAAEILAEMTEEELAACWDATQPSSDATLEENLQLLGWTDPLSPSSVSLYAVSFADKDRIEEAIKAYNDSVDDLSEIRYTDYVAIMISSITTIIDAITYVLIAFVAVSLIVSSIMIGVITLISVQERTKEIGILRAIGASKRDVSGMFNAETMIIGFTAGLIGVLVTWLLCIPINLILHELTGLKNLSAYLPPAVALILIAISVLLTLIAGIIPSRSASRKDPVVALRTE